MTEADLATSSEQNQRVGMPWRVVLRACAPSTTLPSLIISGIHTCGALVHACHHQRRGAHADNGVLRAVGGPTVCHAEGAPAQVRHGHTTTDGS